MKLFRSDLERTSKDTTSIEQPIIYENEHCLFNSYFYARRCRVSAASARGSPATGRRLSQLQHSGRNKRTSAPHYWSWKQATIIRLNKTIDTILARLDEHDSKIQGVSDQVKITQAQHVVLSQQITRHSSPPPEGGGQLIRLFGSCRLARSTTAIREDPPASRQNFSIGRWVIAVQSKAGRIRPYKKTSLLSAPPHFSKRIFETFPIGSGENKKRHNL